MSYTQSHTAVRATRRVRGVVAEAVKSSRRLGKSKELANLSGSNGDILSLKTKPHPVMIRVYPYRRVEDSYPLLNIPVAGSQKGQKARQICAPISLPRPARPVSAAPAPRARCAAAELPKSAQKMCIRDRTRLVKKLEKLQQNFVHTC